MDARLEQPQDLWRRVDAGVVQRREALAVLRGRQGAVREAAGAERGVLRPARRVVEEREAVRPAYALEADGRRVPRKMRMDR